MAETLSVTPDARGALPVGTSITTDIPTRLDRLDWSKWHRRVVIALGITWILDGLEASLIAGLGPALASSSLGMDAQKVGLANATYLIGQVCGALFFGKLTDSLGRKKLFLVTLGVYLASTALSGLAPTFGVFALLRFFAGTGIGGEYSAINSAIDELIPARLRGTIDLAINGSYWVGVAIGAALTTVLLSFPGDWGWRSAFGLGAVLGLVILLVRRDIPESPRWLLMHGFVKESGETLHNIEAAIRKGGEEPYPAKDRQVEGEKAVSFPKVRITIMGSPGLLYVAKILFDKHRRRTILGLSLMIGQAFFYNAIFFTYALILAKFYEIPEQRVGLYMIPFAVGNFLGPVLLGRLFDTIGRKRMIAGTYIASGVLLTLTGFLFHAGVLTPTTQVACWCVVFFFASAAASSAYLTVSELFPVEIRGIAIALFYAFSTTLGATAPVIFGGLVDGGAGIDRAHPGFLDGIELSMLEFFGSIGRLLGTGIGARDALVGGYAFGSVIMIGAGIVAAFLGENAEGKSLEQLAGGEEEPAHAAAE